MYLSTKDRCPKYTNEIQITRSTTAKYNTEIQLQLKTYFKSSAKYIEIHVQQLSISGTKRNETQMQQSTRFKYK